MYIFYFLIYLYNLIIMDYCNDNKCLYNNYYILTKNLNNIFKNVNNDITNNIVDNKKTRNSKLKYSDVLYYKFLYTFKNNSKQNIVSNINFKNNKLIDRTTYHKKDLKINVSFYYDLFDKIKKNYNDLFNKNISNYDIIAVDGTYNNTNIKNIKGYLETNLNMGYYNVTKNIPIDITYCGEENKNREILQLKKYINSNKLKNVILVLDRAYFSYDLINFLDDQNLKYVIRVKNNCLMLNKNNDKNNKINDKINNKNIRFITYKADREVIKKDKNNINTKLKEKLECNIVTNLCLNEYNNEDIKNIYLSRWDIEVFFKFIKYNFKFSRLDEHNNKNTKNEYIKMYYSMLIIIYISMMVNKINNDYIKKTEPKLKLKSKSKLKTKNKYNKKTNKSLLLNGVYLILEKIINNKLETNDLININKNFIKKVNIIIDISNERKSKTPHSKWYIQGYAEHYRNIKIIDALKENKIDELNKNLKIIAKNTKIVT